MWPTAVHLHNKKKKKYWPCQYGSVVAILYKIWSLLETSVFNEIQPLRAERKKQFKATNVLIAFKVSKTLIQTN